MKYVDTYNCFFNWDIYLNRKIIYNFFGGYMGLSMNEKIGQRFMFGINGENIDCVIKLIKEFSIGGVVLYKKNYQSYNDMIDVIHRILDANKNNKVPLFIAIDQEGGRVNRMPSDVHVLKNIYDMSKRDYGLVINNAKVTGKMLNNMGINMNLAPVMDINDDSRSKVLLQRCFYGDGDNVSKLGIAYMNELKDNKVIPVVKHFPGHGASKFDSHITVPYVFNYQNVLNKHMLPFDDAIKAGASVVMVGHLVVRKLTGGLPASISDLFIKKYLRGKMGFDGLVMTDELNMLRRNILYKFVYLKKALISDSDMLLIKINNYHDGCKIINKYKKIILNNHEYADKLDNNVRRITLLKKKYKLDDKLEIGKIKIEEINEEIDKINKLVY